MSRIRVDRRDQQRMKEQEIGEESVQDGWCGDGEGSGDCGNHLIVHVRFPTFPTILHNLIPTPFTTITMKPRAKQLS